MEALQQVQDASAAVVLNTEEMRRAWQWKVCAGRTYIMALRRAGQLHLLYFQPR